MSASPASRTPAPERADAVGLTAHVLFVLVGGLLVFGFAWALGPAVERQGDAACMPLQPIEQRETVPEEDAAIAAMIGKVAPEIVGEDLDGNPVSLGDLRGKFVVLNYWATYCEPCTREWPELDRLAERFADRDDVVVLAVSVDDELAKIPPYLERMGLTETKAVIWRDPTGEINKAYGSEKIPDTFFVDEEGTVVSGYVNVREWGKPAAFHCVDAMAAG